MRSNKQKEASESYFIYSKLGTKREPFKIRFADEAGTRRLHSDLRTILCERG